MGEIQKIKTENYCSMEEVPRKYREINPTAQATNKCNTYAAIAFQIHLN